VLRVHVMGRGSAMMALVPPLIAPSTLGLSPHELAVTYAVRSSATPAGVPLNCSLISAAPGWALVAVGRLVTVRATPSVFQLTLQLRVTDAATGALLGSGGIVHVLEKARAPEVLQFNASASASANSSSSAQPTRITLSWRVAQGTASAEAVPAGGVAPWQAAIGSNSTAKVALQAGSGGGAAVARPFFACAAPTVVAALIDDVHYEETLQCDVDAAVLPAANYTVWGEWFGELSGSGVGWEGG